MRSPFRDFDPDDDPYEYENSDQVIDHLALTLKLQRDESNDGEGSSARHYAGTRDI